MRKNIQCGDNANEHTNLDLHFLSTPAKKWEVKKRARLSNSFSETIYGSCQTSSIWFFENMWWCWKYEGRCIFMAHFSGHYKIAIVLVTWCTNWILRQPLTWVVLVSEIIYTVLNQDCHLVFALDPYCIFYLISGLFFVCFVVVRSVSWTY